MAIFSRTGRVRKKRGFTLLELFTVMFIISALATIMVTNIQKAVWKAKLTGCELNLRNIALQIENFEVNNKRYPESLDELVPTYLTRIPQCPACGSDTYSESYILTINRDGVAEYSFCCKGHHHEKAGVSADSPSYSATGGLQTQKNR